MAVQPMDLSPCVAQLTSEGVFDDAQAAVLCQTFMTPINDGIVGLNTLYLVSSGALVFVMHAGFAMVSVHAQGGCLIAACR
jgi:hypothetical protein